MKILLIRLSALGDVAQGVHVLARIRARKPDAAVDWLVEDRFAPLLEGHPDIHRLWVFERRGQRGVSVLWNARKLGRALRRERFDLALDLQGNLKSGFLARRAGARRTVGLGPPLSREGHGWFVRERVPPPAGGHRMEAYGRLVDTVLGAGPEVLGSLPGKPAASGYLVFHPGTSRFGAFKQWPASHFAALGDRVIRRFSGALVLTAGPGERSLCEDIRGRMEEPVEIREPDGLQGLRDVLAGARLVVASDTGPGHIAAGLGVPTVSMFGPKDPDVFAPVGPRVRAVRAGVRCSPCALRSCPDPVCMEALTVDQVEEAAASLLTEATS